MKLLSRCSFPEILSRIMLSGGYRIFFLARVNFSKKKRKDDAKLENYSWNGEHAGVKKLSLLFRALSPSCHI